MLVAFLNHRLEKVTFSALKNLEKLQKHPKKHWKSYRKSYIFALKTVGRLPSHNRYVSAGFI